MYQAYLVISLIFVLIVVLYKGWLNTTMAFFLVAVILLVFQIVTPQEALHGFANEQVAVIMLLLIMSNVLKKSPEIGALFRKVLRPEDKPKVFLTKLYVFIAGLSAFFNNTPLVAMSMPYVFDWSKKNKVSPSKFLIPLSYASILGGLITLIGTSTTLVVNALAQKHGAAPLAMFDLFPVGMAMTVIGAIFLFTYGYNILPNRSILASYEDQQPAVREYFMETRVNPNSPIIGKTVAEAGLRSLEGLFLVEILSGETAVRPVSPEQIIREGDKLFIAGNLDKISQLKVDEMGLSLPKNCDTSTGRRHDMTEVVISHNSSLIGKSIKENNFRSRYDGAVLAIHRNGERIWGHLGTIPLKAGDVLLVMAGKTFQKRINENNTMYQISNLKPEDKPDFSKILIIFLGLIGSIILTAFNVVPFLTSLVVLLAFSIIIGVAKPKDIKNGIDLELMVIIGIGLALGLAMENSGASEMISSAVSQLKFIENKILFLFILFVLVNIMASIVTAKAAVAILIPIILKVTMNLHIPTEPIVLLIAFASAANFATPFGYQTNLMVYGPGRYTFKDFLKIGIPLSIIYMVVCVLILTYWYNLV